MSRYHHHRSFKGEVGSLLYRLIYLGLILVGLKLFGTNILDDVILAVLGAVTFELVGFILRKIGFWRY